MEYLDCSNNNLTNLNTNSNPNLKVLYCGGNQITGLDLKYNTALTELDCSNNQIASLNVSMCSNLKTIDCSGNKMDRLYLENLSQLISLKCGNNNLSLIDVSGTPKLSSRTFTHDSRVQVFTGIAVNAANFPDANFRACIDTDGNGILSYAEVSVTELDLPANNISSLKGIEYFTALTFLNCENNSLMALDLSNNTALTTLDCSNNSLTALDVSKNTALDSLHCEDNRLTSLTLGSNSLTTLDCSNNSLTTLDVSKSTALTSLKCNNNRFTSLILGNTSELVELECENNKLTQLNISGCSKLRVFTRDSGVKTIDRLGTEINATNFPDSVFRSYINDFDTDGSGSLRAHEISAVWKIDVSNKNISSLKGIECFSELQDLNCSPNNLTALDVSKNTALTKLECQYNQLTTLDVTNNTALTDLSCLSNQLTSLTLGENSVLSHLFCYNNSLTQIDIFGCPQLITGRGYYHDSGVQIITTPTISPETLPSGTVDTAYSANLSANLDAFGSASGLPSWLSFNKLTHTLTGTPTTSGSYTFTVNLTAIKNNNIISTLKQYTITIEATPQPAYSFIITNTSPASVHYGVFYRETLTAEYMGNEVNAVWSAIDLPSWLTLDPDTGELRGIVEDWSAAFTVKAVYGNLEALKEFSIVDDEAGETGGTVLVIENKSLASAETGKYYTEKLTVYAEDSTPDLFCTSVHEEISKADFNEVPHDRTYGTWQPNNITWTLDYG